MIETILAAQRHLDEQGLRGYAPIMAHPGFVLALRRELLPHLQRTDPSPVSRIFGMQIIESEYIPAGHFECGGVLYRYTKPTIDEMCTDALRCLAAALEASVSTQRMLIRLDFHNARERLGVQ